MRRAGSIFLILLCVGLTFACAVSQKTPDQEETQEVVQNSLPEEMQKIEEENIIQNKPDGQEEEFSSKKQEEKNIEDFFEVVDTQGIDRNLSEKLFKG